MKNFTPDQSQGIHSNANKIKILAVAGGGKTTVLSERIRRLIGLGVDKSSILAMTFTRRMANELMSRVQGLKYVGTFHSICLTILEAHPEAVGYQRVSLIGEEEHNVIIKDIINSNYLKFKSRKLLNKYLSNYYETGKRPIDYNFDLFCKLYFRFMKKEGLVSYDLLEHLVKVAIPLFEQKFEHVLVDEYQDTTPIEKDIIKLFNAPNEFVVGDVFQNIYSFRGTTIANLLEFKADEEIGMMDTFRCTIPIAEFANKVINMSSLDYPYRIKSIKKGSSVEFIKTADCLGELKKIIDHYSKIFNPKDFFILTRTNNQIFAIKEYLADYPIEDVNRSVKASLPIAQFTSFLQMDINLYHDYGVERFLKIAKMATLEEIHYWKSIARRERRRLYSVVVAQMPVFEQWKMMAGRAGSLFDKACGLLSGQGDPETVENALSLINKYEELYGSSYSDFIEWVMSSDDLIDDAQTGSMSVMTIHAAKGLENKIVIIPFIEDGVFPSARSPIEEELRLMYVAATRASFKLIGIQTGESIFTKGGNQK